MANIADPAAQALAQLRDIHLPAAINWWPLAPGWYLSGVTVLIALSLLVFLLRRYYLKGYVKRQALTLLMRYENEYQQGVNSQLIAAKVSELLRRVALQYFPRAEVASLQGENWLLFLNNTSKKISFNPVRHELLELPYHPMSKGDLNTLFKITKQWIKQRRGAHV
jgi:hypothetical protein